MANENTRNPQQQNPQRQQQTPEQQNAQRSGQQDQKGQKDAKSTGQKHMDQGQGGLNKDNQGRSQS